jgi:O-Antigen ligase
MRQANRRNPLTVSYGSTRKPRSYIWPAVAIALLVLFGAFFPAGFMTGLNLYFLLVASVIWIASREMLEKELLIFIAPFCSIAVIGLVGGVFSDADLYEVFKDVWYVLNPMVILCVGFVFYRCMPSLSKGLNAFVIAGALVAFFHLLKFAFDPSLFLAESANEIRGKTGTGFYAPVLSLAIVFACRKNWKAALHLPNWGVVLCSIICLLATISSFSRTIAIVFIIFSVASLGFFAKKEWLRLGLGAISIVLFFVLLRSAVDVSSDASSTTFLGKLARSFDELAIEEFNDIRSASANYRGYETARAINSYLEGSVPKLLFGNGFGSEVDLKLYISLGGVGIDKDRRYVPFLHNGFAYLLYKGGAVALLLYCWSLLRIYLIGRRLANGPQNGLNVAVARLIQGIAVNFVFTTWVIAGVFNKVDLFAIVLLFGFLLGYLVDTRKFPNE